MKKRITSGALLSTLLLYAAVLASAQQSKVTFKQVTRATNGMEIFEWDLKLARGKALVVKKEVSGQISHVYLFKARKGQPLDLKLSAKDPSVSFTLWEEGDNQIGSSLTETGGWQDTLPKSGEYRIVVKGDKQSSFTLSVKLD